LALCTKIFCRPSHIRCNFCGGAAVSLVRPRDGFDARSPFAKDILPGIGCGSGKPCPCVCRLQQEQDRRGAPSRRRRDTPPLLRRCRRRRMARREGTTSKSGGFAFCRRTAQALDAAIGSESPPAFPDAESAVSLWRSSSYRAFKYSPLRRYPIHSGRHPGRSVASGRDGQQLRGAPAQLLANRNI
jgi:hypothetical protein